MEELNPTGHEGLANTPQFARVNDYLKAWNTSSFIQDSIHFLPFPAALSRSLSSDFYFCNPAAGAFGRSLFQKGLHEIAAYPRSIHILGKRFQEEYLERPFNHAVFEYRARLLHWDYPHIQHHIHILPGGEFLHLFFPVSESGIMRHDDRMEIPELNFHYVVPVEDDAFTSRLSRREHQVFQKSSLGMTSTEIAVELGLSVHTVKIHRKNILKKLHARNTPEAIRKYQQPTV